MALCRIIRVVLFGLLLPLDVGAAEPDANALFAQAILRAAANASNTSVYQYDKRTTVDWLDSKGKTIERKVSLFLVTMTGGVPKEELVAIEGKKLTPKQLKKEQEKSKRWGRSVNVPKKGPQKRSLVPADLSKRFQLAYVRSEKINERMAHVLAFKPSPAAPKPKNLRDRIINQISGHLWIDDADSEIARLEVALGKQINVWGGVLGALNKFELSVERIPSSEGVWFNQLATIQLDARSLLKRFRVNLTERSSNFRSAPK